MDNSKEKNFEKREVLLDAAIDEFSQNGYENASLNTILKVAGISKGTFYYHFKNKEDLYFYILSTFVEEKVNFFQARFNPDLLNQDIFTILEKMMEYGLEFATINPKINQFTETFMKEMNQDLLKKLNDKFGNVRDNMMDPLIEKAYLKGELRQDISLEFQKRMMSYLLSNIVEIANVIKISDFRGASTQMIKFIRQGLAK